MAMSMGRLYTATPISTAPILGRATIISQWKWSHLPNCSVSLILLCTQTVSNITCAQIHLFKNLSQILSHLCHTFQLFPNSDHVSDFVFCSPPPSLSLQSQLASLLFRDYAKHSSTSGAFSWFPSLCLTLCFILLILTATPEGGDYYHPHFNRWVDRGSPQFSPGTAPTAI